jgi:predicted Rossmann fold flavoprotein
MSPVANILSEKGLISSLILQDGTEVKATNFLIATGGQSYPSSGSSGDAFTWLKNLGHHIINPRAALSPIIVQENIQELEGLSITEAELSLYKGNKKLGSENGDFIFTSVGLSGPAALNLSRLIARQESGDLKIRINFFPEDNQESLEQKLLTLIADNKRLDLVNIFSRLLSRRLAIFLSAQTAIDEHKKGSELTRLERQACLHWLQNYRLSFARLKGFAEAMITVGGIDLKEVDARTMASKLFPNLYLAGEILDADGPTGGYNLQLAWSSAYLAGESIARKMAAL